MTTVFISYQIKKITILLVSLISANLFAQEKTITYNILQNDNVIGQMQFNQKRIGDDLYLKMTSRVKARLVFAICIDSEENSHFNNNKLISSSLSRYTNGKQKAKKQTLLLNNNYQAKSEDKTIVINNTINYNLMLLYCNEPVNLSQVYSDNYQQFLEIRKIGPHAYRVALPDGNYNDYTFDNGECREVEIHHSLFTIKIKRA